jgi:hypothetical protein
MTLPTAAGTAPDAARTAAASAVSDPAPAAGTRVPPVDKCRRAAPSPGQLPVPGIADLARLAMRRLWERPKRARQPAGPRARQPGTRRSGQRRRPGLRLPARLG